MEYNAAGKVKAKFTHGLGIDEPLAVKKGANIYYYHADGLGSIVALTDTTGSVVQTYSYDSFGNMTKTTDISQPYTYTGREHDPETGLYFYRARYYDPKAGRFLTRDPIGFKGGINVYAYVKNNPINKKDPRGLIDADPTDPGCQIGLCDDAGWGQKLESEWAAWLKSFGHYACEVGLDLACELLCLTLPDPDPAGHVSCSVACTLIVPDLCPCKE